MEKFALLHKFPHWSEVLAVLSYSDNSNAEFVHHKRGEVYKDPLGKEYECFVKSHFDPSETTMIFNGSIHLETHILSRGKIPYAALPYKIGIEHTTGYSPWDYLQMTDLAGISASHSEDAQGSSVIFAMNKKFYDRFMTTDWSGAGKEYYEVYKDKINSLVDKGYIVPTLMEPAQFWLENVDINRDIEESNHLCLCLNWCNLNKVTKVNKIVEICKSLYKYTGLEIDIRLHSYSREGLFHILESLPFVHLIPYESMSKYDIMDKYTTYFVDGTGLGYEIAYRNKFKNREVNIFYISGLSSDNPHEGFDGIVNMKAVPQYDYVNFIDGADRSNFDSSVIMESFPHTPGHVVDECYDKFLDLSQKVKELR